MNKKIEDAFRLVDRKNFVAAGFERDSNVDAALPIGYGQTISQPTTVKMMLEWLDPKPGQKILDIGSGSGWTTALLSYVVEPKGYITAVELVPELVKFGENNCKKLKLKNVIFHQAGDKLGWPETAPYDRILVSASAHKFPDKLLDQLKVGGKLVSPVGYDILEVTKRSKSKWDTVTHHGFIFVPLLEP